MFLTHVKTTRPNCSGFTKHSDREGFPSGSVVTTRSESKLIALLCGIVGVCPSIAQLVERWTVVVIVIHRSLVQIRLEG